MRVRENALYLIFKIGLPAEPDWRAINATSQLQLLLAGNRFRDGKLVIDVPAPPAQVSA